MAKITITTELDSGKISLEVSKKAQKALKKALKKAKKAGLNKKVVKSVLAQRLPVVADFEEETVAATAGAIVTTYDMDGQELADGIAAVVKEITKAKKEADETAQAAAEEIDEDELDPNEDDDEFDPQDED